MTEPLADQTRDTVRAAVAALPGGGEVRVGQMDMARAVAAAIEAGRHLIVRAGTGTGKSLAYLVPAVLSGQRVIVATATKALQDQLAGKDLPFLAEALDVDVSFAVLKGRSNYVCRQRLHELSGAAQQALAGVDERADPDQLAAIVEWADDTETGDRAELPIEPSAATWSAVSVGPRECPGRARCPQGSTCFAERARDAAAEAQICVVNLHLYGIDVASGGAILPEHDVVIIDEAHQLEDIVAAAAGFEITAGRLRALTRAARSILAESDLASRVDDAADDLASTLAGRRGQRITAPDTDVDRTLELARSRVERLHNALMKLPDSTVGDATARKLRAVQAAVALLDDLQAAIGRDDGEVVWVEGHEGQPTLRLAPLAVDELLAVALWPERTAILTSATLPMNLPGRIGLGAGSFETLDVGSPFDYETQSVLYCPTDLPDPRDPGYSAAVNDELERLIVAAGGRTLALFTSYRALRDAAEHLKGRLPWPVLVQDDLPKAKLLERFTADEASSLFATMGFWQGIDVPGETLSLVVIDRIPFPRPDDPLIQARRDRAGTAAFREIDLPRAATMLAQGAGRLIRTAHDRGVVAVLDRRLATSKSYRWAIISALPPMRRTKDRDEVLEYLRSLRSQRD